MAPRTPHRLVVWFVTLIALGCGDDGMGSDGGGGDADRGDAPDCSLVGCAFQACGEACTAPCGCCPPVCDGGTVDASEDASGDASASGCRVQADCTGGTSCVAADDVTCGVGCSTSRECDGHEDCQAGEECEEYLPSCCPIGSPLSSRCRPTCTGTDCGTCDATTCRPESCEAGYACPAFTDCMLGAAGADPHGCLRRTCTDDSECEAGTGVCVNGRCYEQAGTCEFPVP